MKIIFEGPDNTGKSTQINNIRKHYKDKGFICTHSSFIKGFTDKEYKNIAKKEYSNAFKILNTDTDIIIDRLHGGETVYGELYRKYSGDYVYSLEKEYNLDLIDDLFLIVFIDKPDNLINRDDGLSFSIDSDMKQKEISKFITFYNKSIIKNKILINIADNNINKVAEIIFNFLKRR